MKIERNKGCFSENVLINNESIFKHEYDTRTDEEISNLKQLILDEISKIKDNLDMNDWSTITEILTSKGNFEYDEVNSKDYDSCDQCGDYGFNHIYNRKD